MEAGESSSEINKNRVQVTRNVSRKKATATVTSEVPIMEVFKKMEQLSTTAEETETETASEADDLPDTLKMTMEHADSNEPIDFHCEAVKKDDGSVQYECKFVRTDSTSTTGESGSGAQDKLAKTKQDKFPRVTGKFSLNVPYVNFKIITCMSIMIFHNIID